MNKVLLITLLIAICAILCNASPQLAPQGEGGVAEAGEDPAGEEVIGDTQPDQGDGLQPQDQEISDDDILQAINDIWSHEPQVMIDWLNIHV